MFDYIEGKLVDLEPDFAVIDTRGWGVKLTISMFTYKNIKSKQSKTAKLYTHMILRDDSTELIGFYDRVERQAYVLLNKVPGIGPKAALSILSMMDVAQLKTSVLTEDIKSLILVPGIGKKTAQKIIIDLKDRVKDLPVESYNENYTSILEAKEVLMSLGFNPIEIQSVLDDDSIKKCDSIEDIVKSALRKLSK